MVPDCEQPLNGLLVVCRKRWHRGRIRASVPHGWFNPPGMLDADSAERMAVLIRGAAI